MSKTRAALTWAAVALAIIVPIALAARSPFLAFRNPIYIAAGFAGITGLALMLLQPLLVAGYLPGLTPTRARQIHRWVGATLVLAVVVHIGGLWITSPPDVIDVLLFTSPTPFSVWGVTAMWAIFAAALLALFRRTWHLSPRIWRRSHSILVTVAVIGTIVHALLIEGAMEVVTKALLCILVLAATLRAVIVLRIWPILPRRAGSPKS